MSGQNRVQGIQVTCLKLDVSTVCQQGNNTVPKMCIQRSFKDIQMLLNTTAILMNHLTINYCKVRIINVEVILATLTTGYEYHYSDGAFGDGSHLNITIRYYLKTHWFARLYKVANISNFTVFSDDEMNGMNRIVSVLNISVFWISLPAVSMCI